MSFLPLGQIKKYTLSALEIVNIKARSICIFACANFFAEISRRWKMTMTFNISDTDLRYLRKIFKVEGFKCFDVNFQNNLLI